MCYVVAKPDDQHADLTEPPDIRHDSWVHLEVDHILKKKSEENRCLKH